MAENSVINKAQDLKLIVPLMREIYALNPMTEAQQATAKKAEPALALQTQKTGY